MRMYARLLIRVIGIIGGHWRRIIIFVGIVVVLILSAVGVSARWHSSMHGRNIVVVVDGQIGEGGLRKRLGNEFTLLVLEVREVTHRLFLGKLGSIGKPLFLFAFNDGANSLVNLVTAILLQIATNVTEQWNITYARHDKKQ